ncbi:MAG TPA: molybdopterin cofactor-binding domain-containing protein [Terriglobia bacterium]|nr:molybdopterin cofactor-binding domain-containing protein [Terriglobia bacterium]
MSRIENVSRRGFLQGVVSAGAFVLGVHLAPESLWAETTGSADPLNVTAFHPSLFVGLEPDGTVLMVAARSEMGTGSRTSLPMIIADEMEADWGRVRIVQALGDAKYGDQSTDGSHSVRSFFGVMRESGATARTMLVQAAAQQWNVPASECEASLHTVVHRASGRTAGYGSLAAAAAALPVPAKETLKFKPQSQWRYIGKDASNYDLESIVTGKPLYGMDAHVDGMLYAAIEHPPVLGGKVVSCDDREALKVAGVRQTVAIDPFKPPHHFQPLGGVAVIADSTWAAFQGRQKLKITWDNGPNAAYDSDAFRKQLEETTRKPCKVALSRGDVDAEFAKGGKIVEAEYYVPHLAHASMEPPVAVANYRDGKVEAWAPTQDPQATQETVGSVLGIPKENVTCHVTLLGGAFGRKSKPDYIAEAAVLSKKTGRPVKVVWTREDDIKFCYYHSVAAMYMKAALGADGMPTAWLQRSAFPPIGSTFALNTIYGDGGELGMGWTDIPFAVPNLRAENGPANAHVRIGWFRSVANIYHGFAVQSFAGELAHAAGRDPLDYLLALLGPDRIIAKNDLPKDYDNMGGAYEDYPIDTARLRRVTEKAAEQAGWGKRKLGPGEGMGVAVHRSFLTYVASVVQVQMSDKGKVRIGRVDTAVDAGLLINPDNVRNQFEGAAVFGTSLALCSEITATGGVINQSNFQDYRLCRINEVPAEIHVHLIESNAPPAGVGEPGVPPFAPALCNAIFAASGKRIRELPLTRSGLA